MRYSALALGAMMAAAPVFAEVGVADFPGCASTCAVISTSSPEDTGCTITDLKCVCKSALYVKQVRACLSDPPSGDKCSAADIQKTLSVSSQLCAQAGVPIQQPSGGQSSESSAASSSTASSMTNSATGSDSTTDAAAPPTVITTSRTSTGSPKPSGTDAAIAVANGDYHPSSTDSSDGSTATGEQSTGDAENNKVGMGFLALAGLAAVAL